MAEFARLPLFFIHGSFVCEAFTRQWSVPGSRVSLERSIDNLKSEKFNESSVTFNNSPAIVKNNLGRASAFNEGPPRWQSWEREKRRRKDKVFRQYTKVLENVVRSSGRRKESRSTIFFFFFFFPLDGYKVSSLMSRYESLLPIIAEDSKYVSPGLLFHATAT